MDKKQINREIRKISNSTSIPLIIFFALTYIVQYSLKFIFEKFIDNKFADSENLFLLIAYIFLYLIIVPIVLIIFYKTRGKKVNLEFKTPFKKSNLSIGWCIKWIVMAVGFAYIASMVSTFIFFMVEQITGTTLYAPTIGGGNTLIGIITTVVAIPIFAPIFEEMLFRGTIYRNSEPMGQWFAIVVSGLTFGLWHQNYQQLIFASVIGMFLAFIYARTRSIFPCMIIHFIINSIATTATLLTQNLDLEILENGDMAQITSYLENHLIEYFLMGCLGIAIICIVFTAIVLFIIELVKHRNVFILQKSCFNISTAKKALVYFSAPATIVLFAFMIITTVYHALVA